MANGIKIDREHLKPVPVGNSGWEEFSQKCHTVDKTLLVNPVLPSPPTSTATSVCGKICGMDGLKKIMYGVTDFPRMRRENAYFVDRTALIPELEKTPYALFLRPRRFGKSLLCAILQCYYDVDYAGRFEELFGGLDIGKNPTAEHNAYLLIDFNFSIVEKEFARVQDSFNDYCSERIDKFVRDHAKLLPAGTSEIVLAQRNCPAKIKSLFVQLKGTKTRLYVIIDEYDNFTNTILSESKDNYERLCHGEGFFKQFFNEFKGLTTGADSPLARMFITGVTPVTLDDVTSGFNIATNISLDPAFAGFVGFSHDDLKAMLAYYRANAGFVFDEDAVFETMRTWYDNYRFSPDPLPGGAVPSQVANPTLVLNFMQYFLRNQNVPRELVDENLRTDYMKIRHIITEGHRVNGNYHRLEDIITKLGTSATLRKSFQAKELGSSDNFVSFLFYNGLVTVTGSGFTGSQLGIPNQTVGEFLHDFIGRAYGDVYGVDSRIFDIANGMEKFAMTGDWHPAIDAACDVVTQYLKVRDAIEGERVVQAAFGALLFVGHGPYLVRHELEANGGYTDIAFHPQLDRWPQIGHAALIELKYFKAKDKLTKQKLAALKKDAAKQLDRYAADRDLARAWHLIPASKSNNPTIKQSNNSPSVRLTRLAIVFHGTELALCEELP